MFQVFSSTNFASFDLGAAIFASCRTSGESLHPKPNDARREDQAAAKSVRSIMSGVWPPMMFSNRRGAQHAKVAHEQTSCRHQVGPINQERRLAPHYVQQYPNTPLAVEALQHAKATHERTCHDPHDLPNA